MNSDVAPLRFMQRDLLFRSLAIKICAKHFSGLVMTRKARSPLDDVIDLAAQLPWQLGGLLALFAYWVLHDFATWMAPPAIVLLNGNGAERALAVFFQYIVPGLLLLAALISFIRRRRQGALSLNAVKSPASDALARMNVHDFERLVAEAFRREGFLVVERARGKGKNGVDLELFMGRDRYLVQCHRWKEMTVDAVMVREFYAVISAERAVGGFIVTSGRLTDEARKTALGRSIRIVPADSLRRLIKKVMASSTGEVTISPMFSRRRYDPAPPACPECGKVMMPRTTRQGGTTVQVDWGCTSFPACQGSRAV
jgi:restriction system protein